MPDRPRRQGAGRRPPRLAVHVSRDGVRAGVAPARLADVAEYALRAEGVRDALVSIALLAPRAMARLNREYLGHRGATDVITFAHTGATRTAAPLVADIYVCPDVARANAIAYDDSPRTELIRLVVHGVLHATGWDHPEGAGRAASPMWHRQERLLAAWRRRTPRGKASS